MKKIFISLACAVICCACNARHNNSTTDGQKDILTEAVSDANDGQEGVADGQMAPDFTLNDIDGKPLEVAASRVHKDMLIVLFRGVEDVNAAMALKNKVVYFAREDAKLPAGRYFIADLIGAQVVDEQGKEIGVLTEVMERPASNIYVVKGETEHLIPAVPAFVLSADADAGIVTVRMIEGM